ncbi:adhesion G-protein coupled receptor G5-like [Micropterus salmoides]|uniref:adhesion G-protein coupled receptor G5-like n=1 Tax=Micropterus salmoides TaxID=27706 RepID=UPI0018EAC1E1|nr:adhesion G-protein coupled receptor G5-like [Micropterus salmoides]
MVPLLLSLLLPELLANQVCLQISDGDIRINMTGVKIVEVTESDTVTCVVEGAPCVFLCTYSTTVWLSGSYGCVEADVTQCAAKVEYSMKPYTTCILYLCNDTVILPLILSLGSGSSYTKEMIQLFHIKDSCPELFSSNTEVKKAFMNVERQIIHSIMRRTSFKTESSKHYSLRALSLNVVNISEADLTGNHSRFQIQVPQLLPQNSSFVPETWLPVYALHTIPKEKRIIGLVNYMQHSHFQFEQEAISSVVIRIELLEEHHQHLHNLATSIKMIFRTDTHRYLDNDSWLQCHYFDERDYLWKTDGCETHFNRTQADVICDCNHATPFAVLLMREPISEVHWKILSYISYLGCGLSAFFTALSLVIYVFSRNHRMDYSISIHVSLSGALFLLNTTFLLTEWGATVKPDWVCVLVAALMHYSLLCCFTWMAIEALHLYLLLIKVFNTHYKHYLVKLSVAGWGIPGVIVAVSLGVKDFKQFYGVAEMTMADTNQTNAICWITDDSFFYSLNLVYFTLIFIFNSGILMAVASGICKMKQALRSSSKFRAETEGNTWRDPERISVSCRNSLTVLGITCLLGTTWGLAFLGSGYVNYPILYLFCILNSTQGFFIFLWICLSAKKQRKKEMEERMTSLPVRTSGMKCD